MRLRSGYEKRRARIEMVPLLDAVFLLLVFFVFAMLSMSVHRGIRVNLPSARGTRDRVESFVLTIKADNRIVIESREVGMHDAVAAASAACAAGTERVLIYGDKHANLGTAVELLSLLRQAGITHVSFLVKDAEE